MYHMLLQVPDTHCPEGGFLIFGSADGTSSLCDYQLHRILGAFLTPQ